MSGIFEQTPANRRRYGVAIFVGIIAGLISAFVKWGAEHPFPPRSPIDFFAAACKVDITGLSQDQIPVSYTHLDVYKRQVLEFLILRSLRMIQIE